MTLLSPPPQLPRDTVIRKPQNVHGNEFFTSSLVTEGSAFRAVHVDGSVDYIDRKALGGNKRKLPSNYFRGPQFIAVLVAQCLSTVCAYMCWLVPTNTLDIIATDLNTESDILWVPVTWMIGTGAGILLFGRLSDIFGRRWFVMATTAAGILGCILASTAKNTSTIVTGSAFIGVAASGQFATNATLGELVSNRQRGPVLALIYAVSIPFAAFGPVVARSLSDGSVQGWRWTYYLGIILNGIALVLYYFFYYPPSFRHLHVGKSRVQQLKEVDWVGICLFVMGSSLFLVGIAFGGVIYPWSSATVLCPLILGIVVFTAFIIYETAFCRVPQIMPPRMFKSIPFVALIVSSTFSTMVFCAVTILWPAIIRYLYTKNTIEVGWQSCIVGGGNILGLLVSCFAISYLPNVKLQVIIFSALTLIFVSALSSLSTQHWASTIAFGLIGCATVGYVENVAIIGTSLFWEAQDIGLAIGVLGSIKALGGSVAQIIYYNIWQTSLAKNLPRYVVPAAVGAGLPPNSADALLLNMTTGSPAVVPGADADVMAAAVPAFVRAVEESLRVIFYVSIPFSAVLLLSACFFPDFRPLLTDIVARKLQTREDRHDAESQVKRNSFVELR